MRYQERIYIQNENGAVRNKDILNVNMSSDICVFNSPSFNVSGATKIDCSSGNTGTTGVYIVNPSGETIPFTFQFTANTDTFTATNATFMYEIYKYNHTSDIFLEPAIYQSNSIEYSAFSATNTTIQNISTNDLSLDGDYIIKGYYSFDVCTDFLSRLGKKVNTLNYKNGLEYNLYNSEFDFYFIATTSADTPNLVVNGSNTPAAGQLYQQVVLPEIGQTNYNLNFDYEGFFVVTLNGLVLANNLDYTYSGTVITLSGAAVAEDIVTIIYTTTGGNTLVGDNLSVTSAIVSGTTNNQGSNDVYFNTTTSKYEIYTSVTPASGGSILVMLNGATLANGVDYYQSTTNPKRIILEGGLVIGDLITIVYFPNTSVVNGLITNYPLISWDIQNPPQTNYGVFTLEVSTGSTFNDFYSTGDTNYVVGQTLYSDSFVASGTVGTELYYRVKNNKKYETLCGKTVESVAYSEIIPLIIQTNAINSY